METNLSQYDRQLLEGIQSLLFRLVDVLEGDGEDRILSCKEAARILGKTPQTVSRYIARGILNKTEVDGVVGIPESELRKITTP